MVNVSEVIQVIAVYIENILDKIYKASELKSVSTNDLGIVEKEVINSLMDLARTTEEIQAGEDDVYEMD
jgi:hypothetical protein